MINNENYTVYKHTSPNNKVYIGITSVKPERRWGSNGIGYKTQMFYRAIQKYGWDNFKHEILYSGLSKEDAEQKEIELISLYQSNNSIYGYNIDNGGNSKGKVSELTREKISKANKGKSLSEETKRKLSEAAKGENNHWYGKHHSTEIKLKISNSHKDVTSKLKDVSKPDIVKQKMSKSARNRFIISENHPMYKKYHSEKSKQKMSESHKGLKQSDEHKKHNAASHKKPIFQYSKNGVFIKKHSCSKEAGETLSIASTSITACCKGRLKSAGGYIWRYA